MITIRFEDFELKSNQIVINYYSNSKSQMKVLTIPDDLYSKAIEFKSNKEWQRKFIYKTVITLTAKRIIEHFIFYLTMSQFEKKFSMKFKWIFTNQKLRPKNVRISSISNKLKDFGIHSCVTLLAHYKNWEELHKKLERFFRHGILLNW